MDLQVVKPKLGTPKARQVEVVNEPLRARITSALEQLKASLENGKLTPAQAVIVATTLEVYVKEFGLDAG
jgi:hypothetical protein